MLKFYGYKKCGTSRKAEKFLNDNNIEYQFIDITEKPPSKAALKKMIKQSNEEINKFFNKSGGAYRDLNMKDKIKTMTEKEKVETLAGNGMLIKRPLITDGDNSTVGFSEDIFKTTWQ